MLTTSRARAPPHGERYAQSSNVNPENERSRVVTEERSTYVGGVAEHQREPLERRADDLGIEDLYWTVIRLGARVDDLETELRKLRGRLGEAS